VVPSGVWFGAPPTGGRVGAFEGVVPELVTVEALGRFGEAEASLNSEGRGEGCQAWLLGEFLGLGTSGGDDYGRGFPACSLIIWYQPPGLCCKRKPGVEGGEFLANG
jgi:hypothetical protein